SEGERDRLRNYVRAYAGVVEFLRNGELYSPDNGPDERFDRPGSGLYAEIVLPEGGWISRSASGPQLPEAPMLVGGEEKFEGPLPTVRSDGSAGHVYRYGLGMVWAPHTSTPESEFPYTSYAMEGAGAVPRPVHVSRGALWGYLGAAGLIPLLLQTPALRWSRWPLRRGVDERTRVPRGQANRMG